jgi:hypothetical protein
VERYTNSSEVDAGIKETKRGRGKVKEIKRGK